MTSSAREEKSKAFAIKTEIRDPQATTFAFTAQKTMYGGKHIAEGDTVFAASSPPPKGSSRRLFGTWGGPPSWRDIHMVVSSRWRSPCQAMSGSERWCCSSQSAIQAMVDSWFGEGTIGQMPEPLAAYLIKETTSNITDVSATFRERYSVGALRRLPMPVVTVVGGRSPELTHRIAQLFATQVPDGSIRTLATANHALTPTHVDSVAEAIAPAAASNGLL